MTVLTELVGDTGCVLPFILRSTVFFAPVFPHMRVTWGLLQLVSDEGVSFNRLAQTWTPLRLFLVFPANLCRLEALGV
jgi:hypothetical protein